MHRAPDADGEHAGLAAGRRHGGRERRAARLVLRGALATRHAQPRQERWRPRRQRRRRLRVGRRRRPAVGRGARGRQWARGAAGAAHAARGGAGGGEPAAHARERDAAPAGRRDARGARQGAPPYPRPRPRAWTLASADAPPSTPRRLLPAPTWWYQVQRRAAEQLRLSKKALAALQEVQAAPRPQLPASAAQEIDPLRVARGSPPAPRRGGPCDSRSARARPRSCTPRCWRPMRAPKPVG